MLNFEQLYIALISIISSQVGSLLKQVPVDDMGTLGPAIYKDRQKQYKEYPYITVDVLSTKANGGWLENITVNELDLTEYTFNYQSLFLISCFGSGSENILTNFKQTLSFESVRQAFTEASGGLAVINRSGNIIESPDFLETDYEETVSMELTVNFRNTIADSLSGVIESIELESNLVKYEVDTPITNTQILP